MNRRACYHPDHICALSEDQKLRIQDMLQRKIWSIKLLQGWTKMELIAQSQQLFLSCHLKAQLQNFYGKIMELAESQNLETINRIMNRKNVIKRDVNRRQAIRQQRTITQQMYACRGEREDKRTNSKSKVQKYQSVKKRQHFTATDKVDIKQSIFDFFDSKPLSTLKDHRQLLKKYQSYECEEISGQNDQDERVMQQQKRKKQAQRQKQIDTEKRKRDNDARMQKRDPQTGPKRNLKTENNTKSRKSQSLTQKIDLQPEGGKQKPTKMNGYNTVQANDQQPNTEEQLLISRKNLPEIIQMTLQSLQNTLQMLRRQIQNANEDNANEDYCRLIFLQAKYVEKLIFQMKKSKQRRR